MIMMMSLFFIFQMVLSEDFYVGTYTNYVSQLSISANGDMNMIGTNDAGPNPSWLLLSKSGKYLFVANEVNDYNGSYLSFYSNVMYSVFIFQASTVVLWRHLRLPIMER
jgi:hypothetical protein